MGYPRLEVGKQCELAPTLLTAMEGKPQPQQDRWDLSLTHTRTYTQVHLLNMLVVLIALHFSPLLA